jgi:hypothetical protein
VQLEEFGKFKNPATSSGIEQWIFRHVAQCLNQLRYRLPLHSHLWKNKPYLLTGDDNLYLLSDD